MSSPPSGSPAPTNSSVVISQRLPPLAQPPVVDTTSPPPYPQIAPFASQPSPPNPVVVLLPPAPAKAVPSVTTPPLPQVTPVTPSPPITIPVSSPPVAAVPPPPPTLLAAPPPHKATPPPIIPVSSPLPPGPPIPSVTSPPLPTRPLPPKNSSPLPPISSSKPATPLPLTPKALPSSVAPPIQRASAPAPATSTTIVPTPTSPSDPLPFTWGPPAPTVISPPLTLPVVTESVSRSSRQSHTSIGLVVLCVICGVFLLLMLGLVCVCHKNRRRRNHSILNHYNKSPYFVPKDNHKGAQDNHSQQNDLLSGSHVIMVQTKTFALPTPPFGNRGSCSMNSGSENPLPPQAPNVSFRLSSGTFSYNELVLATKGFSEANLLGKGGFGDVYKGILPSRKEVAVKQLKEGGRQGEREFQSEVEIISRVHHKHLVSLVGYCISGVERLLVYEFVPNKTLEYHLHGNGQPVMDWATRLKIAVGSAKGLAYLHEDCNPSIIHRDIKAANILLNHQFDAKVSDFGLAKSFSHASTSITHISTRVVGTFGYLAPEYASSGKVTDKSDVYSYGVMLLELITGRLPIIETESVMKQGLVDWARPLLAQALEDGNFEALVDPRLENSYNNGEMASMIACAAACVRHSAWLRPRMIQIVRALEGDISDLNEEMRHGTSSLYTFSRSSSHDTNQYKEDVKNFSMMLASQQYGMSGCSGTTSEYGLNPSSSNSDGSSRQTGM